MITGKPEITKKSFFWQKIYSKMYMRIMKEKLRTFDVLSLSIFLQSSRKPNFYKHFDRNIWSLFVKKKHW